LLRARRTNAVLAWTLVALVLLTTVASLFTGDVRWTVFSLGIALVAVTPALGNRSPWVMPPWEVVLLATLPTLGRLFTTTVLTGRLVTYGSVAALALLIAVNLDAFTPVRMNDSFAVVFVIVTTMATAGVWAVLRWVADVTLATGFIASERALMLEFTASALTGVVAGLVYVLYFRRRTKPDDRVPEGVELP
jgi:hypothetical protein